MAVGPDGAGGPRTARVVLSLPWIVVLVGVCALAVLLVVALLSFRTREREGTPQAAPPVFLPTTPAAASSAPTPGGLERRSASPRASRSSRTPSPRATTKSPSPGATSAAALATKDPSVSAQYKVGTDGWNATEATLSVTNESDRSVDWRVELAFADDTRGLRVSGAAGISVAAQGDGAFVLSGGESLGAGDTQTLRLRVSWDGSAQRPVRCVINGVECRLS
ncbi:cellulose binding domain-containing protein [Micromonospora sp. DT44]|uniref:cellulose binding domain-containing protein n=1 Tax=Micromonospora sp. DT44 TaxID=3393439 RepID=UPI003CE67905